MEFRKVLALRGPNVWANFPCLEAWVDLGTWNDTSSEMMPGFNERLMGWLPTMVEHRCSEGVRGGFFERLRRGTYLAHILEHVTLELQSLAGHDVGYGRARPTSEHGVYKVAIEFLDETVARAALETGHRLIQAAIHDHPFDVHREVEKLRALSHECCLGPSTSAIVNAAKAQGVPVRRLNRDSLVQLGYGARQRRICAAETDRTSAIAEAIAQDKEMTRTLLKAIGVPVPEGRAVTDREDAWEAAFEIGGAVVVKPQFGNHGRGVTTNLTTREQVLAAYDHARLHGTEIVVERFAPGSDYRLLVVGSKLVAASKRSPAQVRGDGTRTVRELVEIVNQDPRRSDGHATVLSLIKLDEIALVTLSEQGHSPDTIPADGEVVLIRRNGNLSTGGTAEDVTDLVHPLVADQAIDAARVVGLDVAGIDVIATDISQPLHMQQGVVCEVNAGPGLRMHLQPSSGHARPVGEAIVQMLFPDGQDGRIPIISVTGVNGKTTTTRLCAHIQSLTGKLVGMTCTDGIYVGSRRIDTGDCSGPQSARAVLLHPAVEVAVLETARGGILREGLAFDRCDAAIVTNIGEGDHLGLSDVDTIEKLAKVKRTIVDVVGPKGHAVLNATDPLTVEMAPHCPGSVIFFAIDPANPVLAGHCARGGRAAFVSHGCVVLAEGDREAILISLDRVPLTHGGRVGFQVENVLAASAACWSIGTPLEVIRSGLETFGASLEKAPGRFNLFDYGGAHVVVDYGHNVSSLKAMMDALEPIASTRRIVVYSAAGDRRDEDMIRQGELLGNAFDEVILYEDQYLRGRKQGEIVDLFRRGLANGTRVKSTVAEQGWQRAIDRALESAVAGDLLLIQADTIDEAVAYMKTMRGESSKLRETTLRDVLDRTNRVVPESAPMVARVPTMG